MDARVTSRVDSSHAGLLSLPRAQRGSVSERRAEGCGLSPSPRQDWRVSRPARGEGGVRWRGGQPGVGRRWWGCHGKSGFIFPILAVGRGAHA
jgi:hypothetical protein